MASPSEMIGWVCGACTYTNDDCTRRDCPMCMTERPKRYFVVPGAGVSVTARTTLVDRREQARLAALRDAVQDAPLQWTRSPLPRGSLWCLCRGQLPHPCPVVELCFSIW